MTKRIILKKTCIDRGTYLGGLVHAKGIDHKKKNYIYIYQVLLMPQKINAIVNFNVLNSDPLCYI